MPQVPPVLQPEATVLPSEKVLLPPTTLEAKVETFFLIFGLWQAGQTTSLAALALRTSSSNGFPHSVQTNSKMGM